MLNIKTKIIVTIGPATLDFKIFQAMVNEGIDFIRINTSYGDFGQYDQILMNLKKAKGMPDGLWKIEHAKSQHIQYNEEELKEVLSHRTH